MPQFTVNPNRFDPYKNFKFRVNRPYPTWMRRPTRRPSSTSRSRTRDGNVTWT
jgi:hypothetical protein